MRVLGIYDSCKDAEVIRALLFGFEMIGEGFKGIEDFVKLKSATEFCVQELHRCTYVYWQVDAWG